MRQVGSSFSVFFLLCLALAGCGGGEKENPNPDVGKVSSVQLTPATLSLNLGEVRTSSAQALNNQNQALLRTITFSSSNTNVANVSPAGLVCAGKWDSAFINCTPAQTGTAEITATSDGVVSNKLIVTVHERVTSVTISPASGGCVAQDATVVYTARAFSGTTDITSSAGTFSFFVADNRVVTTAAGDTANTIKLTGQTPGLTQVFASIAGVNSTAIPFLTCPVRRITTSSSTGPETSFTLAVNATATLASTVLDDELRALGAPRISYIATSPQTVTVDFQGNLRASSPGTSTVVAACSPATCNIGLYPVYGNPIVVNVSGTSSSTAYVTSSQPSATPQLIPIDTSNNTAGTAINLPVPVNSMVFNSAGTRAFLGAPDRLVGFDPGANTVTTLTLAARGRVLSVSPDQNRVIQADANNVYVWNHSASQVETLNIPGAVSASWTPEGLKAFIATGTGLYVYSPSAALRNLSAAAVDVEVAKSGRVAFVPTGSATDLRATCNHEVRHTMGFSPPRADLLEVGPDDTVVSIAEPSSFVRAVPSIVNVIGCPVEASSTVQFRAAGQPVTSATQLLLTPNSAKAYLLRGTAAPGLLAHDVAAGTTTAVTLANATSVLRAGANPDSAKVFVAVQEASGGSVRVIDTSNNSEAARIPTTFVPDILAVRPR